jgi:hypothetical protein
MTKTDGKKYRDAVPLKVVYFNDLTVYHVSAISGRVSDGRRKLIPRLTGLSLVNILLLPHFDK